MNTETQQFIGDPGRFSVGPDGKIDFYDAITLCLERAGGMIDLAMDYERKDSRPEIRQRTMTSVLQGAQQELDDVRHLLRMWRKEHPERSTSKTAEEVQQEARPSDEPSAQRQNRLIARICPSMMRRR